MAWDELAQELAGIAARDLGVSITLGSVTMGAMNITTGIRAKTTTSVTVNAIRQAADVEAVDGGGKLERVVYSMLVDDVTDVTGSGVVDGVGSNVDAGDTVTDGDTVYKVVSVDLSVDGSMYEVTAERWLTGDENDTPVEPPDEPGEAITQLTLAGWGGRRYGSFAGR